KYVMRGDSTTESGNASNVSAVSTVQRTAPSPLYSRMRYRSTRGTLDQMTRSTRATAPRGASGTGAPAVVSVESLRPGIRPSSPRRGTSNNTSAAAAARPVEQSSTWRATSGSPLPRAWGIRASGSGWVTRPLHSMASAIAHVVRMAGPELLAPGSQVSFLDPRSLEAGPDCREGPIHVVVDGLDAGVSEGASHLLGRHSVDDVEPDGEPVLGRQRLQGGREDPLLLGELRRIGRGIRVLRGRRDDERDGDPSV